MSPSRSERFLASQSDDRLVSLAHAGNERAFAAIVERYRPELMAHARRLVTDGRAEDIVQQTFLSAFAALRSGAEVRHLRGWLYRIVRNETIRSHRPPDASLEGVAAAGEPLEDLVAQRALALTALSELRRLPGRQREALVETALQGRGRSEIASAMGLSEGAVRQLVHRARMTLRSAARLGGRRDRHPGGRERAGPGTSDGAADFDRGTRSGRRPRLAPRCQRISRPVVDPRHCARPGGSARRSRRVRTTSRRSPDGYVW